MAQNKDLQHFSFLFFVFFQFLTSTDKPGHRNKGNVLYFDLYLQSFSKAVAAGLFSCLKNVWNTTKYIK